MNAKIKSIIPLSWDYISDSASRLFNIIFSAWDQMNVAVENCLPGGFASIDSDIEAAHFGIFLFNKRLGFIDQ